MAPARTPASRRFWSKVEITPTCWLWRGALADGYGRFMAEPGRLVGAHRFAYELLVGPIPDGLQTDHLCRTRACVNPLHLEPVTPRENQARGTSPVSLQMRQTHCIAGHPFDEENTYVDLRGGRNCRTCARRRNRVQDARRKRLRAERRAGDDRW